MPRTPNPVDTEPLKLSTTPEVCTELDHLLATGLFGKTRSEAAEQLLRERVRQLVLEGWTAADGPGGRRGRR